MTAEKDPALGGENPGRARQEVGALVCVRTGPSRAMQGRRPGGERERTVKRELEQGLDAARALAQSPPGSGEKQREHRPCLGRCASGSRSLRPRARH